MADQTQELLLDIKVAEASKLYKFYLNQEKKILGTAAVVIFLAIWELVGNVLQLINPMFMSAPSLIFSAAVQLSALAKYTTTSTLAVWNSSGVIYFQLLSLFRLGLWSVGTRGQVIYSTLSSMR
jgi:hypothetical protein